MRTPTALSILLLTAATFVACSPSVTKEASECGRPGGGCKKSVSPPSNATATTELTTTAPPLPVVASRDAAADAPVPTGPRPNLPPANVACLDLSRCCNQVRDVTERAGCVGISVTQDPSTCANALVAYQAFGGCSHAGYGVPDIFNPDMTPNPQRNCAYLERACRQDPSACDAAYQCYGASAGGAGSSSYDPCANQPDPYCCRYPSSLDCGASPPPIDPCASHPDPYCCRFPNGFDCGGGVGPNTPYDPCASAPDPYCCEFPNSFDCGGGAGPSEPYDPCASAPDPYCCEFPNSFDCGGGGW